MSHASPAYLAGQFPVLRMRIQSLSIEKETVTELDKKINKVKEKLEKQAKKKKK